MSTLPPPATNKFPQGSVEAQVYGFVESLQEYLPVLNDRNRLGFSLFLYVKGEGDKPEVLVKSLKLNIKNISHEELLEKINNEIKNIHKPDTQI